MGAPKKSLQKQIPFDPRVAAVRQFNRFYTQKIGVLNDGLLGSRFSLTAVRVLYELAQPQETVAACAPLGPRATGQKPARQQSGLTATDLAERLGLDEGYLSRILKDFARRAYIRRTPSRADGRASFLSLTAAGRRAFAPLSARSSAEVEGLLDPLAPDDRDRLIGAMGTIQRLLGGRAESAMGYTLRPHRPGDMGWVVHRHGALYYREFGWDERFEALVAQVVAGFVQTLDPARERCWIADRDGEILGSVFLVRKTDGVAKLRLLLVEPAARGLGLGTHLVDECIEFAREVGYKKITLWTNSVLAAARSIYEKRGFCLVHAEPHELFGQGLIGETWEKQLGQEAT